MAGIRYRPDIDGLRAIAVLAVLFYHAGFSFAPGGFMGVDIFFVISGFLITSLIRADMDAGTFTLFNFWERRARRILPPLFVVVIATMAAGAFIFLPFDYALFGKQMMSQSVFASNLLFVKEGGYFDTANDVKPLLHTWSLAVEEQFYLFFPIGMLVIGRFLRGKFFTVLFPLAVLCFMLSIIMVELSQRMAFYLLPFRGWELLAGALMVFAPPPQKRWEREGAGIAGLLLIAIAILLYDGRALFPGYVALLPVLGTAALIWSGPSLVGRCLSIKPFVWVGLISYSLYLWHWPVMTFVRYHPLIEFTPWIGTLCIAASLAMAILTWRYVENPVRRKKIFQSKTSIFAAAFAMLAIMGILGLIIYQAKGFPSRLDPDVVRYSMGADNSNPHRAECDQPVLERIEKSDICQTGTGKPKFILWGDSHADAIAPAFYSLSEKYKRNGYVVTGHGCPPILEIDIKDSYRSFNCRNSNQAVLDLIKREKIKHVFLVASWSSWLHNDGLYFPDKTWYKPYKTKYDNKIFAGLQRTIDLLQKQGVKVHLMMDTPVASFDPPRVLALEKLYDVQDKTAFIPVQDYTKSIADNIGAFKKISSSKSVLYVDPKPLLCDKSRCRVEHDGESLYFNPGHVSVTGALYLQDIFSSYFKKGF